MALEIVKSDLRAIHNDVQTLADGKSPSAASIIQSAGLIK
jgi:hypothetical protein